jgi:hypothetical protein
VICQRFCSYRLAKPTGSAIDVGIRKESASSPAYSSVNSMLGSESTLLIQSTNGAFGTTTATTRFMTKSGSIRILLFQIRKLTS